MLRFLSALAIISLFALSAFAVEPVAPADAFITVTCLKALPDGAPLTLELATAKGVVKRAFIIPAQATKPESLKLEGDSLTGEATATIALGDPKKNTKVAVTIDAKIAVGKVTGTYTGKVDDADVKGELSGNVRSLVAPLGGPDFYPSPERVIGYRGDGNGCFPGATPMTQWWDGTPKQVDVKDSRGRTYKSWTIGDNIPKNIVWRTEMPGWANGTPLVVGDRVFTLADTGQMVCVDINTGKILWTKASNPWEIAGVEKEQAGKIMEMYQIFLDGEPAWWAMTSTSTMSRVMSYDEFKPIVDIYRATVQPRIVARLKELDPAGPWDAAAKATMSGLDYALANLPDYKGGKFEPAPREKLNVRAALRNAIGQRISALSGNKPISLDRPWHNIVGWCMASPVSDGKFIYAFFGQNYVVCYDLDGNVKWQHFIGATKFGGSNVYMVASPVLRSGVLMVTESSTTIRALDAKTGALLWRREGVVTGGYTVGTPKAITLGPADKPLDALVTGSGAILRVKDGVIIGDLGYPERKDGGRSIIGTDNFVVKGACGDGYSGQLRGYRLKYVSDDKIEAEMAWEGPKTSGYEPVATDGKTLLNRLDGSGYLPIDLTTGKNVGTQSRIAGIGSDIRLWSGNYQIQCGGGSGGWGGRAADGSAQLAFTVLDVTDPAKAKIVSTNILSTKDRPRIPIMEKLAKELYDLPNYCSNSFGWPPQLFYTESGMTTMGNRLFLRATGQLYCLGDPAVPYNWNPASRPQGE